MPSDLDDVFYNDSEQHKSKEQSISKGEKEEEQRAPLSPSQLEQKEPSASALTNHKIFLVVLTLILLVELIHSLWRLEREMAPRGSTKMPTTPAGNGAGSTTSWRHRDDRLTPTMPFVEIGFLNLIFRSGAGFFVWILFGLDKENILTPVSSWFKRNVNRLRTFTVSSYNL